MKQCIQIFVLALINLTDCDGDGFIKGLNTEQQQRLNKPTLSAETELDEDRVGPG